MKNRLGLPRRIPDPIKREIRQRCKFGCVICGFPIYQYEHIKPEFFEAKTHDPEKITLLCGKCHDQVTKKLIPKSIVIKKNKKPHLYDNPSEACTFHAKSPLEVIFCNTIFRNTNSVITINNENILSIRPSDEQEGLVELSGFFCDEDGTKIFEINNNEYKGNLNNWDIEITKNRILIRKSKGNIALKLLLKPPHSFVIKQINMNYQNYCIEGNEEDGFKIKFPNNEEKTLTMNSCVIDGKGIKIEKNSLKI